MVEDDDQELTLAEREQVLAGWDDARPTLGFAARVAAVAGAAGQQPQRVVLGRPRRSRGPVIAAVVGALAAVAVVVMVVMMRREGAVDSRAQEAAKLRRAVDEEVARADKLAREIDAMQFQIASASEADRAALQQRLARKQSEMAAAQARAKDAQSKMGDRRKVNGRPKIDLDVDTSNATGGIGGN